MVGVTQNTRFVRVGRGAPMGELLRRYWHPVAAIAELSEKPIKDGPGHFFVFAIAAAADQSRRSWLFRLRLRRHRTLTSWLWFFANPGGTWNEHVPHRFNDAYVDDKFATPRSWVARQQRVDRWSEIDVGGTSSGGRCQGSLPPT